MSSKHLTAILANLPGGSSNRQAGTQISRINREGTKNAKKSI
jgi:hypothetical protein